MVSKQIFDTLSLPQILNYTIGFDRTFDRLESNLLDGHNRYGSSNNNYPPYNIKKVGDLNYVIELAVAGFGKNDIEVKLADGILSVKSDKDNESEEEEIIHRGISYRKFETTIAINSPPLAIACGRLLATSPFPTCFQRKFFDELNWGELPIF